MLGVGGLILGEGVTLHMRCSASVSTGLSLSRKFQKE